MTLKSVKTSSPHVTSQIHMFVFIPNSAFLVRFRNAVRNRRIFISKAPQFAQKPFQRVDYDRCCHKGLVFGQRENFPVSLDLTFKPLFQVVITISDKSLMKYDSSSFG